MESSLRSLKKASKGKIIMSSDLEEMLFALHNNMVPRMWKKVSYPSLMPLNSWMKDLKKRIAFFHSWIEKGPPMVFWLPGFFFPQGILTAILQKYSRKTKIPIDHLRYEFVVLNQQPHEVSQEPNTGMYVGGLYMTGARWDKSTHCIANSVVGELISEVPVIWFKPTDHYQLTQGDYVCPLYVTSARAGTMATSGLSTNFITAIDVPANERIGEPSLWTQRGVALLCQPD